MKRVVAKAAVLLGLAILITGVSVVSAQPDEVWNRTYDGKGHDIGSSIAVAEDGGYLISGWTDIFGAGRPDAFVVKTDSNGTAKWNRTFGGPEEDRISSVRNTPDGGYILAGKTRSYGAGGSDAWLIKMNSSGKEEWNKTFGGRGDDSIESVQNTADGGYILAGGTGSFWAGWNDAWLIKVDFSGKEEWNKTFGGPGLETANSVLQTEDGGYIFAGYTGSYGAGSLDLWLVKTDLSGNKLWDKTFGGFADDVGLSVKRVSDGGYIISGSANASSSARGELYKGDAWVIKTDSHWSVEWSRTFNFSQPGYHAATDVEETEDGGFVVTGYSFGRGIDGAWMVKIDSSGADRWNMTFGKPGNRDVRSVLEIGAGEYIVAGAFGSYDEGQDVWLIKVRDPGVGSYPKASWNMTYGGPGMDVGWSFQQTRDGGYIIVGWTDSFGAGKEDVWLIKTDGAGREEWNHTYGGYETDLGRLVLELDDGYLLMGTTQSYGSGGLDLWLIKTDVDGDLVWDKTFGGPGDDLGGGILPAAGGGYILGGSRDNGSKAGDVWLIKIDNDGNELWNRTIGGPTADSFAYLVKTSDGGYAIAAQTDSRSAGKIDAWLVKTDQDGNELWNTTLGGPGFDHVSHMIQTMDGGFLLTGRTESPASGEFDLWLVKVDSEGDLLWEQALGGPGWDEGCSVLETGVGYLVAGSTSRYIWLVGLDSNGLKIWDKRLISSDSPSDQEGARSMLLTVDGGYALLGSTSRTISDRDDIMLLKMED